MGHGAPRTPWLTRVIARIKSLRINVVCTTLLLVLNAFFTKRCLTFHRDVGVWLSLVRALRSGRRSRRFESSRPDHFNLSPAGALQRRIFGKEKRCSAGCPTCPAFLSKRHSVISSKGLVKADASFLPLSAISLLVRLNMTTALGSPNAHRNIGIRSE